MRQKSNSTPVTSEKLVRDIRRATRKQYSAEEKIRIILDGLRGETPIAELCRREGIAESMYYSWSKEFLEAGKRRLAGDTTRAATTDEVKQLRREAQDLKEVGRAGPRGELLRSLFAAALVATSLSPLARSPASADQYAARDGFDSRPSAKLTVPSGDSEMAAGAF
jgi:transposase